MDLTSLGISNAILIPVIIVLTIWEGIWKALGLWKAGRNNQIVWFVSIFIFNTFGILPILYLLVFQKKKK